MKKLISSIDAILHIKKTLNYQPKTLKIMMSLLITFMILVIIFGFFGYIQDLLSSFTYIFISSQMIILITYLVYRLTLEYDFKIQTKSTNNPWVAISFDCMIFFFIVVLSQRMVAALGYGLLFPPVLNMAMSVLSLLGLGMILYFEFIIKIQGGILKTYLMTTMMLFLVQVSLIKILGITEPILALVVSLILTYFIYCLKLAIMDNSKFKYRITSDFHELNLKITKVILVLVFIISMITDVNSNWPFQSSSHIEYAFVPVDTLNISSSYTSGFPDENLIVTKDFFILMRNHTYHAYNKDKTYLRSITLNSMEQVVVMGDDIFIVSPVNFSSSDEIKEYSVRKMNENFMDEHYMTRMGYAPNRYYQAYVIDEGLLFVNHHEDYFYDDGSIIVHPNNQFELAHPLSLNYIDSHTTLHFETLDIGFKFEIRSNYHEFDNRYRLFPEKQHKIFSEGFELKTLLTLTPMNEIESIRYEILPPNVDDNPILLNTDLLGREQIYIRAFFFKNNLFHMLYGYSAMNLHPTFYASFDMQGKSITVTPMASYYGYMDESYVYLPRFIRYNQNNLYEIAQMDLTRVLDYQMIGLRSVSEYFTVFSILIFFVLWNNSMFNFKKFF